MRPIADRHYAAAAKGLAAQWRGRSGRCYGMVGEKLESFTMDSADLYVIAKGSNALWVGSTDDLVSDPTSRVQFRLALDCGTAVFRLEVPETGAAARWDIEGGEPVMATLLTMTAQAA